MKSIFWFPLLRPPTRCIFCEVAKHAPQKQLKTMSQTNNIFNSQSISTTRKPSKNFWKTIFVGSHTEAPSWRIFWEVAKIAPRNPLENLRKTFFVSSHTEASSRCILCEVAENATQKPLNKLWKNNIVGSQSKSTTRKQLKQNHDNQYVWFPYWGPL